MSKVIDTIVTADCKPNNTLEDNTKMSEEKHCYGCRFYKPYYVKGNIQFDKCDIGLCAKKKATVEKRDICDKYENMYYARISYKKVALSAIAEHINVLAELKQILEEDDEEDIAQLLYDFKNRKK